MNHPRQPTSTARNFGFTLVELLVVIGIIALLISILLPALNAARQSANTVKCASNVRQLATALLMYASENYGRFPPETLTGVTKMEWYDQDRIGKYLPKTGTFFNNTNDPGRYSVAGPIMVCPAYAGLASNLGRCYAMNIWAACISDQMTLNGVEATYGRLWNTKTKASDRLILITEVWSPFEATVQSVDGAVLGTWRVSGSYCGIPANKPGERFGTGNPPFTSGTGWGDVSKSQLAFVDHRSSSQKAPKIVDVIGRINIAYADGHVSLKAHTDLADYTKQRSTYDSLWSPKDPAIAEGSP